MAASTTASALARADAALLDRGCLTESRTAYAAAHRLAREAGDPAATARAALGLGGLWVHEEREACPAAATTARQREALEDVGDHSSPGLRLRVRLAAETDYRTGSADGIRLLVDEARSAGDEVALAEALSLAHHCLLGPDHARHRGGLADELLQVASRTGRPVDTLMGMLWTAVDHLLAGDPMAERSVTELRARLAQRPHGAVDYVRRAIDVMLAIRAGRLVDAERLATECAAFGQAVGDADAAGWYAGQLTAIRWYQGRSAELVVPLTALAGSATTGAVDLASYAALAVGHAAAGNVDGAACALARVRGEDFGGVVRSSSWLVALYASAEAAHRLHDEETAALAYRALLPFADLPVMLSLGVVCLGSTHHPLGVAALTTGDLDAAVHHLRCAVRANLALGHRPAVTLSRHRLAQALRLRAERDGRPDDALAADSLAERATRDAVVLGVALEAAPVVATVRVTRVGADRWSVCVGPDSVVLPDSAGLRYLGQLAARPGEEVAALDLVRAVGGTERPLEATGSGTVATHTGSRAGGPQAVLDERALRAYRSRLAELGPGDERDWLEAEIARCSGLGGRSRAFADDRERARVAVTRAIRRALAQIDAADERVGRYLTDRVHTGGRCRLDPA